MLPGSPGTLVAALLAPAYQIPAHTAAFPFCSGCHLLMPRHLQGGPYPASWKDAGDKCPQLLFSSLNLSPSSISPSYPSPLPLDVERSAPRGGGARLVLPLPLPTLLLWPPPTPEGGRGLPFSPCLPPSLPGLPCCSAPLLWGKDLAVIVWRPQGTWL